MNRVHDCHNPETYGRLRHFVLGMHDTTFECVAASIRIETTMSATLTTRAAADFLSYHAARGGL